MMTRIQYIPAALVCLWLLLCCWHKNVHAKPTTTSLRLTLENSDENDYTVEQDEERQYLLLTSLQIRDRLLLWANQYPTLIKLTTAQEEYGLPTAGNASDCSFDQDVDGCLNYIFTLQDYVTHPEGSDTSNHLPEVMLSGELHGDERVGPTAVMETAALLLLAASCIAYPRLEVKSDPDKWKNDLELAATCRQQAFDIYGVNESQLRWLARLVTTRRIVIVPTANALGYYRGIRTEGDVDPNCDFAFDQDPALCMRTITTRTLNEVFREHMFQQSLTFHGGIELIGYEWGNTANLETPISPDDLSQNQIAAAYSQFADEFSKTPVYVYGAMNDGIIYSTEGGFDHWAYAGSWEDSLVRQCTPGTFGGYPIDKTTYEDSTLRSFNMLIETSANKTPSLSSLGSTADILNPSSKGNGYVSRNLRLSLLAIEVVQPWSSFLQVNGLSLTEDIIPLQADTVQRESCQSSKRVRVPASNDVLIEWKVGGGFTVDQTTVFYALWDDIPADMLNCLNQPSYEQLQGIMMEGTDLSRESGNTEFDPATSDTGIFSAVLDLSMYSPTDEIVVLAVAQLDQDWATMPNNAFPQVPPQSHIVNVRTNPDWHYETADGKVVQGRLNWFSAPLTIEIGMTETVELSKRE